MHSSLHIEKLYLVLILLTAAIFVGNHALAAESSTETPYVTTIEAKLRKGPGAKYDVIQTIPKETRISVVGKEGAWLKVQSKHGREPGYIEASTARPIAVAVTKADSPAGPATAGAYITTGEVNLREGAGTKFKVLRKIPKDTRITVTRVEGNWLRVESKTGNPPGYIDKRFARQLP
jgi:uncharacterized protein YgiM (DUF1202 family)